MVASQWRVYEVKEVLQGLQFEGTVAVREGQSRVENAGYLPPVVLQPGVLDDLARAGKVLRTAACKDDKFTISVRYEDSFHPAECFVVLRMEIRHSRGSEDICFEPQPFADLDEIGQTLSTRSVILRIGRSGRLLAVDCYLPIYPPGASTTQHRNVILLVEDDSFVRHATCELLTAEGYFVHACSSAEEAVIAFDRDHKSISILISDVRLPGSGGRELARRLREREPNLPILLVSGYPCGDSDRPDDHIQFLAKPYDGAKLLSTVRACLRTRHPVVAGPEKVRASVYC